jgi:hypothetical protein
MSEVVEIAKRHDVALLNIGVTMKERLRIDNEILPERGSVATPGYALWIDQPVKKLSEVWENALAEALAPAHV